MVTRITGKRMRLWRAVDEKARSSTRDARDASDGFRASVPKVRILLPPAESHERTCGMSRSACPTWSVAETEQAYPATISFQSIRLSAGRAFGRRLRAQPPVSV